MCPGFHTELDAFFAGVPPPTSKDKQGAGFVALQGKKYASLVARMEALQDAYADLHSWQRSGADLMLGSAWGGTGTASKAPCACA